jgi:histidine triad (HIT) family protein
MSQQAAAPCLFCSIASGDETSVTVYEDDVCRVFMDLYPISPGHMQIIPKKHYTFFHELPANTRNHLAKITQQVADAVLKSDMAPVGYNLLNNNGRGANQHVAHVHIHVIPRYKMDYFRIVGNILLHLPGAFIFKASADTLREHADKISSRL